MTYPYQPPGPGDPNSPQPPQEPVQPYQPPQLYQPDNSPYAAPYSAPYAAQQPYPPQPYAPQPFQQPYAPQPPAYQYDYGYGGYFGPPPRSRQTDSFAVASLVVSCISILGLCTWGIGSLLGVLGAIFGHVSRRRIRTSGAGGGGMALAGIIVGWSIAAIGLVFLTIMIVMIATTEDTSY